jgi:hypothetical protein
MKLIVAQLVCTAILLIIARHSKRAADALTAPRKAMTKEQEDLVIALGLRVRQLESRVALLETYRSPEPHGEAT